MNESLVLRIVQVGVVTAVDAGNRTCRVKFPDTGLTSGWLRVIRQTTTIIVSGKDTDIPDNGISVLDWMPKVNDTVVVIYIPVFNSDGFVIGVV